ncbi:MAG TPA: insulinase family protein [Leptolyngbyaceae cyanobacterium M33_DOE_097]|uniref:Insulinase family protein n=1 Tax=Oscillatoriales cyanobacterium SpSt-418 TaxID=2282169 RepID=A0A7C3KIM4_9CYAN|nr:insulinase family protein [Leptolyngbyaceae cyanobacterium M33_DOE_097]
MSLPSSPTELQSISRTVLDNGIVVLVKENPAADIIAARLFLRAGSQWETAQNAGLSHLVSAVLTKGTENRSSLEIAEAVESVGASLGADSTTDYFLLSLKTVSADFPGILKLAGELLRSPTFPEHELELERRLTLQAIRSQQEQPFNLAFDQLRQIMYTAHPYALSSLGTEASVVQPQREDLLAYHKTFFRPDQLIISICGRIQPEEAVSLVQQVLGDWQIPDAETPTLHLPGLEYAPARRAIAQATQQSIVMLGYMSPAAPLQATTQTNATADISHLQEYVALKLLNSYLGNGLSSRLFVELREKRGLAYEVSGFYPTRLHPAQFIVYMGTAPENTQTALESLHAEVDRLQLQPLTQQEFQTAKNKLLGQYALGKQTNAQIAQIFGWYETIGLGIDFDQRFQHEVAELPVEIAQVVAQRYLKQPYVSLVGPAEKVMPLVA